MNEMTSFTVAGTNYICGKNNNNNNIIPFPSDFIVMMPFANVSHLSQECHDAIPCDVRLTMHCLCLHAASHRTKTDRSLVVSVT